MFISGRFLQSKEWGDFQKSLGRKIFWIKDLLIIKIPLKFGYSYLYSPKGTINKKQLDEIKKIAIKEKVVFVRYEPAKELEVGYPTVKTKNLQPACTQILDLSKSEEDILARMKQKTRYNIRLAEKKGVEIKSQESRIKNKEFDIFYNLIKKTYIRQNIRMHNKEYYRKLAEFNKIFIAYYDDKPVAGAMVNLNQETATYLHGGSSQEHKQVMAPYLLHWEIIKYAKSRGYKFYDWWGINPDKWPGITKFKIGFGGEELCSPGTYDIPINKTLYKLYKYVRK